MSFDPTRWRRVRAGWVKVPPPACPACGWGWPPSGAGSPSAGWVQCMCAGAGSRGHTTWTCRCGAVVAEGCLDVWAWGSVTTAAGLPDDARWAWVDSPT